MTMDTDDARRHLGGSGNLPPLPETPEAPAGSRVLGVGLDLVHIPGLAQQLTQPGTVFAERAFTVRERREARRRAESTHSAEVEHLAARWAAKEAFIKAWSTGANAHAGHALPPALAPDDVDWRDIEIVTDRWGRPSLRFAGVIAGALGMSLGEGARRSGLWPVSLTHDATWAAAVVLALAD